jgi:S-disulfanyl-L-cysteine oxidoreductase SoxD
VPASPAFCLSTLDHVTETPVSILPERRITLENIVARCIAVALTAGLFGGGALCAAFAPGGKSVWDGVYSEAQATRGQVAYEKECSTCHGANLAGGGMAPGLIADAFNDRWKDGPVGDIFVVTKATMPQDRPAALTDETYVDIVAYLLKVNKYPSGPQDLSKAPADLAQITFDKPAQTPKQ